MNYPAVLISVIGALVVIGGVILCLFILRARHLNGRVGSFESALCIKDESTWVTGVCVFGAQYISFFPSVSLKRKPLYSFSRARLNIVDVHQQDTTVGTLVLHVTHNGTDYLWAMSRDSKAGLVSWMEAAPPSEEPTAI